LGLSVFLPTAEISIVSTSLVTISEDLNGFDQSSWVITAYLCAFTGRSPSLRLGTTITTLARAATAPRTARTACAAGLLSLRIEATGNTVSLKADNAKQASS
jgi:hypothetical protein